MEKKVHFHPGYDKRSSDPKTNYGVAGVEIRFLLKGKHGAVQFVLYTDWEPKHVQEERWANGKGRLMRIMPMGTDVGYHAYEPQYDGQSPMTDSCPYLDGKRCYYDGSSLAAEPIRDRFLEEGDKAVWYALEELYIEQFGELD